MQQTCSWFYSECREVPVGGLGCLLQVFQTLLCLLGKVKEMETQRKRDLLFIISPISSAKHDFSLLITLSVKIKCFPKDLASAVVRTTGDLFRTPMNSLNK